MKWVHADLFKLYQSFSKILIPLCQNSIQNIIIMFDNYTQCLSYSYLVVRHSEVNSTEQERGENRECNGGGNGRDQPTGQGTDKERLKGRRTEARRPAGSGREKAKVGGERDRVPGVLRGRKCRLDSALTTSGTGATEDWISHSGECPRPTWNW